MFIRSFLLRDFIFCISKYFEISNSDQTPICLNLNGKRNVMQKMIGNWVKNIKVKSKELIEEDKEFYLLSTSIVTPRLFLLSHYFLLQIGKSWFHYKNILTMGDQKVQLYCILLFYLPIIEMCIRSFLLRAITRYDKFSNIFPFSNNLRFGIKISYFVFQNILKFPTQIRHQYVLI